jgi:hypothetical protein
MSWTKLDDRFWSNPKVVAAENEAVGVYARMLSYCGGHLTDGHVPGQIARFLGSPKALRRLVETKLIAERGDDFEVVGYLECNPSAAEAEELRRRKREAGRVGGLASGRSRREASAEADASSAGEPRTRTRPVPRPVPEKRTLLGTRSEGENGVGATAPEDWTGVVE